MPMYSSESAAREIASALTPGLAALDPVMLTAIRETVANAEEAAWRRVVARRVRAVAPGPYDVAEFTAVETKYGYAHDDFSDRNVLLFAKGQGDPNECVDLDDAELTQALGALSELLRPNERAELSVDLDQPERRIRCHRVS
ncbi:hypothetical protein ACFV98_02585 [Streptomyces violascens]|uniref:hypothetical protein n=1 Tax=Streptomyces violascens TaxID=67381 RepID=UPI003649022C